MSGIHSETLDNKIYGDPTPTYMYLGLVEHIWKAIISTEMLYACCMHVILHVKHACSMHRKGFIQDFCQGGGARKTCTPGTFWRFRHVIYYMTLYMYL